MTNEFEEDHPEDLLYTEYAQLALVTTLGEAYVIRSVLSAEGIPVRIENEHSLNNAMGSLPMPIDGIQLFAPTENIQDALALLAEHRAQAKPDYDAVSIEQAALEDQVWKFYYWFMLALRIFLIAPFVAVIGINLCSDLVNRPLKRIHKILLIFAVMTATAFSGILAFLVVRLLSRALRLGPWS